MQCFRLTHDSKVTKLPYKYKPYFPKCLEQHENHFMVVVTAQSYKENLIVNERQKKDAPSGKITTRKVQREKGGWFHV